MRRAFLPVLAIVLTVTTTASCSETWLSEDPGQEQVDHFDQVWQELDLRYSHFELKGVDWVALRARYRPDVLASADERVLFRQLCDMLEALKDGHVDLMASFDTCSYGGWYAPFRHNYFPERIRDGYLRREPAVTGGGRIRYGMIASDVGYVHIGSFSGTGWADDIDVALSSFGPSVSRFVVDVRDNGGGSSRSAEAIAGRFADRSRVYARYQYRNGPKHTDFAAPKDLIVSPVAAPFTGKVALLTNRRCFSACESFTLAMTELPGVVSFGDTTGGGLGNPIYRELPNGWRYRFPIWLESTVTGELPEGKGIPPDRPVHILNPAPGASGDTILDRALSYLRQEN